jgi:hypothetical protein
MMSRISLGMDKPQIVAILGKPGSVTVRAGYEDYHYQLSGRHAPPLNPNGAAFSEDYIVRFKGGQVDSYGRADELQAINIDVETRPKTSKD